MTELRYPYLTDEEVDRFENATEEDFRPLTEKQLAELAAPWEGLLQRLGEL